MSLKFPSEVLDTRIIEVETKMALNQLNSFETKLSGKFGNSLSGHFNSATTVATLFELNNNRPAYVNDVVKHTLEKTNGLNISDDDFNKVLRNEMHFVKQ